MWFLCLGESTVSRWAARVFVIGMIMIARQGVASVCVTELTKIVRTPNGRVTSHDGKPIPDAEIVVKSSSGEIVFQTKSNQDGTFQLVTNPSKYRVEVDAKGHLRFLYIVDLRSREETGVVDVSLQDNSECHDMRVISEEEGKEEERCGSELVSPNLTLKVATVISGQVKDETGAPFKDSELRLVSASGSVLQPGQVEARTDENGRFTFEEVEPGSYRLLASPHRGFAQPEKLACYEKAQCELDIVLKASATNQPYAGCPVK